jgi:hypothetical protein
VRSAQPAIRRPSLDAASPPAAGYLAVFYGLPAYSGCVLDVHLICINVTRFNKSQTVQ